MIVGPLRGHLKEYYNNFFFLFQNLSFIMFRSWIFVSVSESNKIASWQGILPPGPRLPWKQHLLMCQKLTWTQHIHAEQINIFLGKCLLCDLLLVFCILLKKHIQSQNLTNSYHPIVNYRVPCFDV